MRASLYDRMGNYVSGTEAQLLYSFKVTSDGGAEMDADELMGLIARAIDGTPARPTRSVLQFVAESPCAWLVTMRKSRGLV